MPKKIDGKNAYQWRMDGLFNTSMERYDVAINCFENLMKIEPENYRPWFNLGVIYNEMEKYDKAIECFEKGIDIYNAAAPEMRERPWDSSDIKIDEAFIYMGKSYDGLGNLQKKIEWLEKAIKIAPTNKRAWWLIGNTYFEMENYDKVIEYAEKAVKIDPQYLYGLWTLGEAYYKLGDYQKAIEFIEKTLEVRSDIKPLIELLEDAKKRSANEQL
ncbi:MAG: tetratricopeptide repeat protein [Promethearchaeota archaeon]